MDSEIKEITKSQFLTNNSKEDKFKQIISMPVQLKTVLVLIVILLAWIVKLKVDAFKQQKDIEMYKRYESTYSCNQMKQYKDLQQQYEESTLKYDAVITIDQFKDLTQNQMYFVYKNDQIRQLLNGEIKALSRVVGLLGLRNKGKTFILNQMIDYAFPSSNNVSTKGISIKISKTNENDTIQTIFMDTEGISKPSQINWKENGEKMDSESFKIIKGAFTETSMIEKIQQEVVSSFSQVLIIVVGFLQHDDQKLIEQTLYLNMNQRKDRKKIFIIHNLKEFTKISEVEDYQQFIQKVFPLEKQIFGDMTYYIDKRSDQVNVEHLLFAQKFSEAGNQLNQKTLTYLSKMIDAINQKFNFEEEVKKNVSETIQKYSIIKQKNQILQKIDTKTFLTLQYANCTENSEVLQSIKSSIDLQSSDSVCTHILLNKDYIIEKAQYLIQDSIGIFHSSITYEIYQNDKGKLSVYIDTPGNQNIKKIGINRNFQKLIIESYREPLNSEKTEECTASDNDQLDLISSNISYSESQIEIELPQLQQPDRYYYRFLQKNEQWHRNQQGQYLIELQIEEM